MTALRPRERRPPGGGHRVWNGPGPFLLRTDDESVSPEFEPGDRPEEDDDARLEDDCRRGREREAGR